jgi:hypothetical protein
MKDELLVVHANPKDVFSFIGPPEEAQRVLFGEVGQPDDDPKLIELLSGTQSGQIAHGHFHFTSERSLLGIHLVNVAHCSFSRFDRDRRARYTIFTWEGEWKVERRYFGYEFDKERKALLASDMPGKGSYIRYYQ